MSFKDKVVIVAGASSGIGAATAVAFAAEGAKVTMVGRSGILDDTLKLFGKLDIVVNNAGVVGFSSFFAPNAMEVYAKVMATNLHAVVYLTHLAAPHLIKTKGNIVNVSSIAAMEVMDKNFAYQTSKACLDHFTRSIAFELARKGVRANTVNPGPVKTDMIETMGLPAEQLDAITENVRKQVPLNRFGESEEIAGLILFLASDKARSITGFSYVTDNGTRLSGPIKIL